jgi:hypothetical protein
LHFITSRSYHFDGEIAEHRKAQRLHQQAAVGVRIHAHAAIALRRQIGDMRQQTAVRVEEFFGFVAAHPVFEDFQWPGFSCSSEKGT